MFLERLKNFLMRGFAVDLGTANTLIYARGRGVVLNEPTAIASNKFAGEIIAIGRDAISMLGREPRDTVVHRPLKDGTIADQDIAEQMLRCFFRRAGIKKKGKLFLQVVVGLPSSATEIDRRAVREAARRTGISKVHIVEEGLAAAIGAGVPVDSPNATMVVDIGGGTTDITVVGSSSIIISKSLKVAGDEMNEAIINYVHKHHEVLLSERIAELVKLELGAAFHPKKKKPMQVIGKKITDGAPKEILLTNEEVFEALDKTLQTLVNGVRSVIEQVQPQVISDIYRNGIVLTGGGALLSGLDARLKSEVGISVSCAANPLEAVVLGAGHMLDNAEMLYRFRIQEEAPDWEVLQIRDYDYAN